MEFLISSDSFSTISYLPNITSGVTWDDVFSDLTHHVPSIKQTISKHEYLGIGLQLSSQTMTELSNPSAFAQLRLFLSQNQCFLYTLEGFNKSLFDWKENKVLSYHNRMADLLTQSLPPQITGSICTVPGTPKSFVNSKSDTQKITQHWVSHAEHLIRLERGTGKHIVLAIKPEMTSFLETEQQAVDFLNQHVFSTTSCAELSKRLEVSQQDAEDLLRTHITLCLDVGNGPQHYPTLHEHVKAIETQGISIGKKLLSANSLVSGQAIENVSDNLSDNISDGAKGLNSSGFDHTTVTKINELVEKLAEYSIGVARKRAA